MATLKDFPAALGGEKTYRFHERSDSKKELADAGGEIMMATLVTPPTLDKNR